jgi:hypothetical protein
MRRDQLVGDQVGRVLTDRVGEHDVELMQVGDIRGGRTAIDDDERAALDISSGNRVDHAQRSDPVRNRDRTEPFGPRVPIGRVAGLEIAGRDYRCHAVPDRRIEQRRAIGGRHAEQRVDALLAQPLQDVVGDGESHSPTP